MFSNSLRISEAAFCVYQMFWDIVSQSFPPVLRSASKQHISGGREHSSPIQSIPSPEFHSRLHCEGRETSPIGELLLKMHHAARPLETCLYSTEIPVVYRGKETALHVADGVFLLLLFFKISADTPRGVRNVFSIPVKRLFKVDFKSCMTKAHSLISVLPTHTSSVIS